MGKTTDPCNDGEWCYQPTQLTHTPILSLPSKGESIMQQCQPIVKNGVLKDQHLDRINGEHISFTHIVSEDNVSDSISISLRVNDIHLEHLGKELKELSV